jgi:hypothetical protein
VVAGRVIAKVPSSAGNERSRGKERNQRIQLHYTITIISTSNDFQHNYIYIIHQVKGPFPSPQSTASIAKSHAIVAEQAPRIDYDFSTLAVV